MTTATHRGSGGPPATRRPATPGGPCPAGCAAPQDRNLWFWVFVGPFVLGLLVFVYVPIAWSLLLSFFDARNTVTPTTFVGLGNYADMLTDRGVPLAACSPSSCSPRSSCRPRSPSPSGWRCWSTAPGSPRRSSGRCSSCRPRAPTSWPRWSGRCRSSPGSASAWPTRCSAGSASSPIAVAVGVASRRGTGWSSSRARLWLQVGFYMILFLAGLQRISPDALRGGRDRRRARAGRCSATSPCRSCARRRRRCCCCCSSTRSRRSTSSTTCSRRSGQYPPYARPPLVYLYYTALGQGQDFGHGSAGAVILTLLIAVVALGQGRVLRLGQRED